MQQQSARARTSTPANGTAAAAALAPIGFFPETQHFASCVPELPQPHLSGAPVMYVKCPSSVENTFHYYYLYNIIIITVPTFIIIIIIIDIRIIIIVIAIVITLTYLYRLAESIRC